MKSFTQKCIHNDYGRLVLRLGLGVIFLLSGWMKVQDMDMVVGYFGTMGFSATFAYLVAYGELLGGAAIILGLLTRFSALVMAVIMAVVLFMLKFGNPILAPDMSQSGFELVLFTSAMALVFLGAGRFSLDRLMWKKGCCGSCGTCCGGVCPADAK